MVNKSDTSNQSENTDTTETIAPNWLKDLGEQSWQAELVISGLIVTILFQLPDIFIKWAETTVIQSGEIEFTFLFVASISFLIGIDCLIVFFGVHFVFRGIWIALLGLNSVYPNGIDAQSKKGMGEKYWQKTKEKYPNLTAYNIELDSTCSLIFSMATVTIIILTSFSVVILALYQCIRFLISYFPIIGDYIGPIGIIAYLAFTVTAFLTQYLGKKYPDNKRIEKIVNGYSNATSTLFALYVFQKPIGYITSIYTSNDKSKYTGYVFMLGCVVMGYVGGRQIGQSRAFDDFSAKEYFTFNNKPHQILAFNYENLMDKAAQIYTPVIQSDMIADDFLKVFIPTIAREIEHSNFHEYGIVDRVKMNLKRSAAQREAHDKERLEAYKQFNRLYINDVEVPNLTYQFYTHPQASERGLLVYVPSEHFVSGKNILEIRKNYFSKDSIQKVVKIPFFFEKKE
jgi:hypothetical protein